MFQLPQNIPSEAVNNLATTCSQALRELRELTEDFTKSFDEMSVVRQRTVISGMGKLNAYFTALGYLGAGGVGIAIMKMEAAGIEDYLNVLGDQLGKEAKADEEMMALKEKCLKRGKEWKEPKKPDLNAPSSGEDTTAKAANG